jgi:hypothetical protein
MCIIFHTERVGTHCAPYCALTAAVSYRHEQDRSPDDDDDDDDDVGGGGDDDDDDQ